MSIAHILVHLDSTPPSLRRLDFALGLARRQQAALSVCCAVEDPAAAQRSGELERLGEHVHSRAHQSEVAVEWLVAGEAGRAEERLAEVCRLARCSDLVIAGQPDPNHAAGLCGALPEQLVRHSGRPVLILPYAGHFSPRCERILVAWSGGRESTRALHDALPLLRQARQTSLLSLLGAGSSRVDLDVSQRLAAGHLERHGLQVRCETQVCVELGKGDQLLNRCADEGIELLVAGGCHKGQISEVATHLLRYMTLPVLLSH